MFSLVCLADLTYAWVFNEYPYFVQQDNRRFVSQQTGNLYIAKVEPSDVGNYTCVVMNSITKGKVHSSPTALILRTDGKSAARGGEVTERDSPPRVKRTPFQGGFNHRTNSSALCPVVPWRSTHRVLMPVSEQLLLNVGQQTKAPKSRLCWLCLLAIRIPFKSLPCALARFLRPVLGGLFFYSLLCFHRNSE